jgi:hypothetical protein
MAKTHVSNQPIEPGPSDTRSADAKIIVDDNNVARLPTEFDGTIAECVLPPLALQIGIYLLQR